MAYKVPKTEEDLIRLKVVREAEGPYIEYKSSRLLTGKNEKVFEILSKEITAFGNSAGGVLIIGVEEDSDRCIKEFVPIADASKTDSWIEDGLLPRISPPISITIETIEMGGGRVLVIDVPASHSAPHQASDRKYYARRLFRVDPLLAFEIDDIRRRSNKSEIGVTAGLWFDEGLINFSIRNDGIVPIFDVSLSIEGVDNEDLAAQWTPGLGRPYIEPFKVIYPEGEQNFLGAGFEFFKRKLTDSLMFTVSFSDELGGKHEKNYQHYLRDYEASQRQQTKTEKSLEDIGKQLESVSKALKELSQFAKSMGESVLHPSGLNLSKTTLQAISQKSDWKWAGENLSPMALAEVLEIRQEDAFKIYEGLYGSYHFMGGRSSDLSDLDVDDDVKEKIRRLLVIPQ